MRKKKKNAEARLEGMPFDEALARFVKTSPGELADAMTRPLVKEIDRTRKRIKSAQKEIESGARTRPNKDRFRL